MKIYTGIGARKTPEYIQKIMTGVSLCLEDDGYTLRSGGAEGADTAFESSVQNKEIYLPWSGFNNNRPGLYLINKPEWSTAREILSEIHPDFVNYRNSVQNLFTRNVFQILGADLKTPSEFVMCWTPDGCVNESTYTQGLTGGTGIAIKLASRLGIPVYNLYRNDHYQLAKDISDSGSPLIY